MTVYIKKETRVKCPMYIGQNILYSLSQFYRFNGIQHALERLKTESTIPVLRSE